MHILILHGWNLSGSKYNELATQLRKKKYKVCAPDMPGFGEEPDPSSPYTLDEYVAFVYTYIKRHKFKKLVIIGHSFGGRVAIKLLSKYPDIGYKLILTGVPGVRPESDRKIAIYYMIAKFGKAILSLPILRILSDISRKILYYRVLKSSDYYQSSGVMRDTFKSIIAEDLTEHMRTISIKVELVWGDADVITPVWIAQKMNHIILGSTLTIVPKMGHSFIYKQPKKFVAVLNL